MPLSRWQVAPASAGSGPCGGPAGSATPLLAVHSIAPATGSFSSVADYDCGPAAAGDAAWAVAQAAALHAQQPCSPPGSGLPANLSASTAGDGCGRATLPAEHSAVWQQHLLQHRQRVAAARRALRDRMAAQQQWRMQQQGAGLVPLPSPTDSDASAAFHFGCASPAAAARPWADPCAQQALLQQAQQHLAAGYSHGCPPSTAVPGVDPRSMRPAPVTTGAPAPVLAAAASAFASGRQGWHRQAGAARPPTLPMRGHGLGAAQWAHQPGRAGGAAGWPSLPRDSAAPGSHEASHLLEHSQAMLRAASAAAASRGGLLAAVHSAQQLDCTPLLGERAGGMQGARGASTCLAWGMPCRPAWRQLTPACRACPPPASSRQDGPACELDSVHLLLNRVRFAVEGTTASCAGAGTLAHPWPSIPCLPLQGPAWAPRQTWSSCTPPCAAPRPTMAPGPLPASQLAGWLPMTASPRSLMTCPLPPLGLAGPEAGSKPCRGWPGCLPAPRHSSWAQPPLHGHEH